MNLKLLVSPLAKGAYFADYLEVARAEIRAHYPETDVRAEKIGALDFLGVELDAEVLEQLARLSFVQGIFEVSGGGLVALDRAPGFAMPEALVYGAKYRGKTNEIVTQLAVNVGLAFAETGAVKTLRLLDPMAGRGTTLFWALRYGMDASGIELDAAALDGLQQHVKKQTKLCRIKHEQSHGYVGKRNRRELGRFIEFRFGERTLRLTAGDSRDVAGLAQHKTFHLLVADLPYGVQHVSSGGTRNPLQTVSECAPAWADCLRPGGVMVLVFNSYQPKRSELVRLFADRGLDPQDFSAPHRMSESILRDLVVFKKPRTQDPGVR